jgi:hypothetical protein
MAPNRYTPPPKGMIWVPTPTGQQAMTLDQYRQYQAAHPEDTFTPEVRQQLNSPEVQRAIQSGETTTVQVGTRKFHVEQGRVTAMSEGGIWKPIAMAGAVAATGGLAGAYLGGAAPVAASTTPATAGGVGTAGATGVGAAGAGTAAGVLPATTTVPLSTGTVAGLGASGAVPAATTAGGAGGVLGGIGRFLSSPGGATALGVGGQLAGAAIQSSGISKAAEIEAAFQREALQYEKERDQYVQQLEANRYGELTARLQPYIGAGQAASDRQMALMGLSASSAVPNVTPVAPGADFHQRGPATPGGPAIGTAVPRAGTAQMVTVRAPTGEQRMMAADQAQRAVQLGAQIVG